MAAFKPHPIRSKAEVQRIVEKEALAREEGATRVRALHVGGRVVVTVVHLAKKEAGSSADPLQRIPE